MARKRGPSEREWERLNNKAAKADQEAEKICENCGTLTYLECSLCLICRDISDELLGLPRRG